MRSTILAALAACGGATSAPPPVPTSHPAPKAAPARIFAPGVVSTELPEFATAVSADGKTVYFDRATADRSSFSIVASRFVDGAWLPAEPLPFSTGEHRDVDPFVVGDRLYFSSNRPPANDFDTWYVERRGAAWSEPVHVEGAPSGPGNQVFVSIARDGTMYFQSDATGGGDIYRAPRVGDGWPEAAPIDAIVTPASESNPAISPDGTLLVFAADRPGGSGGPDLHGTRFRDGAWSPPVNLGTLVNSPQADFAPAFSQDGHTLYFTSERPGIVPAPASGRPPGDIYAVAVSALDL